MSLGISTLRIGIGARRRGSAGPVFTFASLYQSGEDGMVWDLGDPSTLYQDAARTNPVTATGQQIKGFEDVSGNGYFGATASGLPGWEYRETAEGNGYAFQAQLGEQLDVPVAMNAGEEWTFFVAHNGTFEMIDTEGQFMMGSATNESGAGNATGLVAQENATLTTFGSETVERIKVDGSVITPADRGALHDQTLGTSQMIFDLTVDSVNVWTSTRIGAFTANNNRQPPKGVFVFGMINRRLTAQEEADIKALFSARGAGIKPTATNAIQDQAFLKDETITPINISADFSGTEPITYALAPSSAALPSGLSLDTGTGIISGALTADISATNIIVRGTNLFGFDDTAFSLYSRRAQDPAGSWQFDLSEARLVLANYKTHAPSRVPSFFHSPVDVQADPDFDTVLNVSTGERLNYLVYTSTDHTTGGTFLSLCFGDPVTGTWKSYEQARQDGDLVNFAGTTPEAPNSLVANGAPGPDNTPYSETPWVRKVGSEWVMTFHQNRAGEFFPYLKQATYRFSGTSPFGPFEKTPTSWANDVWLNVEDDPNLPNADHTGYAFWYPTPAEVTGFPHDYMILSLYRGGGDGLNMIWGADSNMLNPEPVYLLDKANVTATALIPEWEVNAGFEVDFQAQPEREMRWDGTKFRALTTGGQPGSGPSTGTLLVWEYAVSSDLHTVGSGPTPIALLGPSDFNYPWLFPNATRVSFGTTVTRPGGGEAAFVEVQDDNNTDDNGVLVMPVVYDDT